MTHGDPMADPENSLATALADGRQSQDALVIVRGVMRLLHAHDFAAVTELTLASGRRADVFAVSGKGDIWIAEVKSSIADFRSDQKWPEYMDFCDRFYFAVGREFPVSILPDAAGIIVADRYGGELLRESGEHRLAASRRKSLLLGYGRVASYRLMQALDPDIGPPAGWRY